MNILITGGTGFVGGALVKQLLQQNHRVFVVSRREKPSNGQIRYIKTSGEGERFAPEIMEAVDAVVNLAGENIGGGRWSQGVKNRILNSRIMMTRQLVESIQINQANYKKYPEVLINASAVGFYGTHPTDVFSEDSPQGRGFLAEVCRQWEAEARQAEASGVRVVILRFGVVLGPDGGVLARIAEPFKYSVGGVVGDGSQWFSWVHRDDVLAVIAMAMEKGEMRGVYNLCSPHPVTMHELVDTLARTLGKKAWTRMPGFLARLAFGEMADEMLLNGQRVMPTGLLDMGYRFKYPDIQDALASIYRLANGQLGPI